jgi:proteasome lid subunit RPN8/RPN11
MTLLGKEIGSEGEAVLSTPFQLRIPRATLDAMIEQAREALPNECCGLLAGHFDAEERTASASTRFPLTNVAATPTTRYEADPKELFKAFRDMREQGLEHVAIYHTHPTSQAAPSRTDLERAFYPGVVYLIFSMLKEPPELRAWWLDDGGFVQTSWKCEE